MSIRINLLGGLALYHQGNNVTLPKSKRTRALLAYLIVTKRPHRRDRLCEVFWESPADVKGALRWSLSKLRPLVNDSKTERLWADRESIFLQSQDISIDVDILSKQLKKETLTVLELKKMLMQLENPLLSSLELPEQIMYQEWLVAQRNETNRMLCKVLAKLSDHTAIQLPEQLDWNKTWIEKDPYSTVAANQLLSKLEALGYVNQYKTLASELALRFEKSGIQWKDSGENIDVKNNAEEECGKSNICARQRVRFCTTEDKVKLAYASMGEGYPIVKTANWLSHLEHDWDSPIWLPLFKTLSEQYQLIRYDERGNGLSDWHVRDISFDAFAKDLETIVKTNKLEKFALLGISQGASVAIDYAIKYPEKVSHLIIFGGYAEGWRKNASKEEIKQREAIMTLTYAGWGQDNPAYRQIFSSTFLPSANKEELDWFNDFQRLTTSPENAVKFLSAFGDIDVHHHLANIKVPTLVMHSIDDQRISVESARKMASIIPNAEFVGLNSDGHLLLGREKAAKDFVDTINEFVLAN